MLKCMTSHQIAEWISYAETEPFGELRDDLRFGQVCATMANIHRDSKRAPEPFEPGDFFSTIDKQVRNEPVLLDDPEAQSAMIKALFEGANKNE